MYPFQKQWFPVEARLEHSIVLAYAVDRAQLEPLIPDPLILDLFEERLGFLAVAMVQTRELRPAALPKVFGRDFILIGYRIFVRFPNPEGKRRRGLFILRSDTDRRTMRILGNLMTKYNYRHVDVVWETQERRTTVRSDASRLHVAVHPATDSDPLPEGSPFASWKEARRFAGPMPHTFSVSPERCIVTVVQGRRQGWRPQPLVVEDASLGIFEDLGLRSAQLANAFEVRDIPYRWERGIEEPWTPRSAP